MVPVVMVAVVMVAVMATAAAAAAGMVVLGGRRGGGGRGGGGLDQATSGSQPAAPRLLLQDVQFQALLAAPAAAHQHTALGGDGVDAGGLQGALHALLLVLLRREAPLQGQAR